MVVKSRFTLLPDGVRAAAVHVADGRIVDITDYDAAPSDAIEVAVLAPGLVDTHVHVNEPGRTHWEGFATATRAAAAGGVTTLVDMPLNSIPPTTTVAGLEAKRASSEGQRQIDVAMWGGAVRDNAADLPSLHDAGVVGFKAFLCESGVEEFPFVDRAALDEAMRVCAELDALLIVHAEHPATLDAHAHDGDDFGAADHATWLATRPREAEDEAIRTVIELMQTHRGRVHIVHLSSASALPLIADAKARGLRLTVETCPHYLCLSHEEIPAGATEFKCAPPIRERENQDALWAALDAGLIDIVVTDHSPAPADLKHRHTGAFPCAWGGIASLQVGGAMVYTERVERTGESGPEVLATVVKWMADGPARLVGLSKKGRIEIGADADLAEWDLAAHDMIDGATLQHRHPLTPYAGRSTLARVRRTWLRGALVYDDGTFATPSGRLLSRDAR